MSGIGGVRALAGGTVTTRVLRDMTDLLRHRGPDESAVWVGQDVGLAHTRLTVVDRSHSSQPVHSVDGRWVLALDGQVSNHHSLRSHLDYPFRSGDDAEVVVAGLALEGISFVERLHGQFALAAHDLRTDTTHLVRDRLGVLPLHYRHVPGGIAFGSEVKALLAVGPAPEVDRRSLDAYLASGIVPAPDTLFEGVKKVRPAHRLSIHPEGHLEETPYWTPPPCDAEGTWSDADAVEAVSDGVREAVRAALGDDRPVGAYLSGGLASSLVAAEVQQVRTDGDVHTFSAHFDESSEHGRSWALRVSVLLGTSHHPVHLPAGDFEDLWGRLTWHRDAPITDPADIAAFGLARAAHEHVRVVLSDEGADELFGAHPAGRLARLAERPTVLAARLLAGRGAHVDRRPGQHFDDAERRRLLGGPPPPERRAPPALGADLVDQMLRDGLRHRLPDNLLERDDRFSKAASVDLRAPLLDHHLVELALRLPTSVKVRSRLPAWVLGEVARPLLPADVIAHREAAPRVPLESWLRGGLRDSARDRLTGAGSWVGENLDRTLVGDLVDRHDRGAAEEVRLWTLLCLEVWHECFFSGAPQVPGPRGESATPRPAASGPAPA